MSLIDKILGKKTTVIPVVTEEVKQYVKIPRLLLECGHTSGSYSTDLDGKRQCNDCYNKRFSPQTN